MRGGPLVFFVAGFFTACLTARAQEPPGLAAARRYTLGYVQSLPDYTCLLETRRLLKSSRQGSVAGDTIDEELSFVNGAEQYKVLRLNGAATKLSHAQIGGPITQGEFAAVMKQIFDPNSATAFRHESSGKLEGRAMDVLAFRVPTQSGYVYRDEDLQRYLRIAYAGSVWVDAETGAVMKISMKLVDLPKETLLESSAMMLDFKPVSISGKQFILPSRFEWSWRKRDLNQAFEESGTNQVTFSSCRKFTTESTIDFGK